MINRDPDRLDVILEMIGHLKRRLADVTLDSFMLDRDEQDLTAYRLAVIGESSFRLSPELKARHPAMPWAAMYKMRNVIAHDYPGIDMVRIYETATTELDSIRSMASRELDG